MKNELNWETNGKAFFLQFSAGRSVIGTCMVGATPDGQWVSGALLLGARQCEQGYYKLQAETPKFSTREEAEADAMKLAGVCVDRNFDVLQYIYEGDTKRSPWKNTPAPVKTEIKFESK